MIRRTVLGLLAGNVIAARKALTAAAAAGPQRADAATTNLAGTTQGLQVIPPSANTDPVQAAAENWTAISNALTSSPPSAVQLLPGTYYLSQGLTVAGTMLAGSGPATQLTVVPPGSTGGFTGSAVVTMGDLGTLRDLQVNGGSTTRSSNFKADAVTLSPGAAHIFISSVFASYVNGWVLNATGITRATHLSVKGLRGTNNSGGVTCAADPALLAWPDHQGITAQIALTDLDIQQCETSPALKLENVYDISVQGLNCAAGGPGLTPAFPTIHLVGGVSTALFSNIDAGVFTQQATGAGASAGWGVLMLESAAIGTGSTAGTAAPNDICFSGCTFQQGGIGVKVQDVCSRIRFSDVMAKSNLGPGWQFNGAGTAISVQGCSAYANGGTDVDVTGPKYVGLFGFAYCSAAPGFALAVTSSNNVTNASPTYPGQRANSGTPSAQGWMDPLPP